ncbi:MAG: type III-B CRISPR module RAMP protein Cmr6 [Deltaproteobacteria bacterium]|nr:type III-B CRISPR module RAMP protein Cmr6 [Deltaproteobacteria bacterium]
MEYKYPLPEEMSKIVKSPPIKCSMSLYFNKWVKWPKTEESWSFKFNEKKEKKIKNKEGKKEFFEDFRKHYEKSKTFIKDYLDLFQNRNLKLIETLKNRGYETKRVLLKNSTRLICGLGGEHPTETSITLHRFLGIPYIPSTSIKGMLRASVETLIPNEQDKINMLFGLHENNQDKRGVLILFDAFPIGVPSLEIDIMNPHYSKWYSNEGLWPSDDLDPTPIFFLTVAPGTTFNFNMVLPPNNDIFLIDEAEKYLIQGLSIFGIGAKTRVNYGYFEKTETELKGKVTTKKEELSLIDKAEKELQLIKPTDAGRIGTFIDKYLKELKTDKEKRQLAGMVRMYLGKNFKKSKAKEKLKAYLN